MGSFGCVGTPLHRVRIEWRAEPSVGVSSWALDQQRQMDRLKYHDLDRECHRVASRNSRGQPCESIPSRLPDKLFVNEGTIRRSASELPCSDSLRSVNERSSCFDVWRV